LFWRKELARSGTIKTGKTETMQAVDTKIISGIPLFQSLGQDALENILQAAREQTYDKDNFIFYQDDPTERVFVLKSGRLKLTQLADDGQQVLMRVITGGMLFAAIGLVKGAVYPVTAQAAEECRVLYWPQDVMLELLDRHPKMALNALQMLAGHVREFQDRYRELATERVERRLARAVLRLASQTGRKTDEGVLIDIPLTRQDLAEISGTTLFTVSRIFSQWEDQGLILAGRERVVIRFPHGLVAIAEDLPPRSRE
jgi:CRP-like cAMP-binding protein